MKNLIAILLVAILSVQLYAANGDNDTKTIKASESSVAWEGKKITGSHNGLISISEGSLEFDGDKLVDGLITIDMASMTCSDLKGNGAQKLLGHLHSADFFNTRQFATATLDITNVADSKMGYTVTGDLTIKGITKPVTFDASMTDNGATATIVIDRTAYDIKYGSGKFFDNLGDKTISDEFTLDVSLVF